MIHDVVARASAEKLLAAHKRTSRIATLALGLTLACIVAGIWIDWRWLPTSLVPLTVCALYSWCASVFRTEIDRRIKAREASS